MDLTSGSIACEFPIFIGMHQGSAWSPFLFNGWAH